MGDYWSYLMSASALLLVFEGILPFLSPDLWRRAVMRLSEQSDQTLRLFGATSMGVGVFLMVLLHSGILS